MKALEDDSVDVTAHPAIVGKRKSTKGGTGKPKARKSAVRRPVTVSFETDAASGGESTANGRSKGSKRKKDEQVKVGKVSGKKSTSRKKEAKAKNSSKRRKRR